MTTRRALTCLALLAALAAAQTENTPPCTADEQLGFKNGATVCVPIACPPEKPFFSPTTRLCSVEADPPSAANNLDCGGNGEAVCGDATCFCRCDAGWTTGPPAPGSNPDERQYCNMKRQELPQGQDAQDIAAGQPCGLQCSFFAPPGVFFVWGLVALCCGGCLCYCKRKRYADLDSDDEWSDEEDDSDDDSDYDDDGSDYDDDDDDEQDSDDDSDYDSDDEEMGDMVTTPSGHSMSRRRFDRSMRSSVDRGRGGGGLKAMTRV